MRYTRQPDLYSCGPTSILNALKWAGEDVSIREHLPFIQFGCRTIDLEYPNDFDLNGTTNEDFDRVLRYVGKAHFQVRRRRGASLPSLIRHLKAGGSICMVYHWEEGGQSGDHFCFLAGFEKGKFVVVNDHTAMNEDTVSFRTISTLKRWLKKSADMPCVWFLTLKE